jgi:hypothetical protein
MYNEFPNEANLSTLLRWELENGLLTAMVCWFLDLKVAGGLLLHPNKLEVR